MSPTRLAPVPDAPPTPAERIARLRWAAALPAQLAELDFDLDAFMLALVERVMAVTTASGVIVELVEGDDMVYRATSPDLTRHLGLRLARKGSLSGLCVEQGRALECRDSETDQRVDREACRRIGLRSMVCAPIISGGETVGVLKATWGQPDGFGAHDLEVLDLLACSLAAALAKQVAFEALYRESEARRLQAEALAVARAQAESAAAANADFLANMSHEIRNPITAIVGFVGLLDGCDLPPQARHFVERISAASSTLLSLVNDVLDLSKLQAGEMDLRPRPTDVPALAGEVMALFETQATAKGLLLAFESPAALPAAHLDDRALRQVLTNLIGNAVKFTDAGEVRLTLRWQAGRLTAAVHDTGAGMSSEAQARLFQRYQQAAEDDAPPRSGTGLGLAISRALVELMDGDIGVTSQSGVGTTFHFEIAAPAVGAAPASATPPTLADLDGVRILVADDGPANRELVRSIAQSAGAEVTEAADGHEAVGLAQLQPFDVILLDRRMPGLGGVAAAEQIRAGNGPNADIPILVFSADALAACDAVFDGAISKPVTALALTQALSAAVDSFRQPATIAQLPRSAGR